MVQQTEIIMGYSIHIDQNIGVTGAKVHWMRSACGKYHWCRKAVAIMGGFNIPFDEVMKISPFDPSFHDNYVEGKGRTKEDYKKYLKQDESIQAGIAPPFIETKQKEMKQPTNLEKTIAAGLLYGLKVQYDLNDVMSSYMSEIRI